MTFRRALLAASALLPLALSSTAQVPPGHALWSNNDQPIVGLLGGWETIDPATSVRTPITGLTASEKANLYAWRMDPTDGTLLAISTTSVVRVALSGSAVVQKTVLASASVNVWGIDFDRDGNVFFCADKTLWRIDTQTGIASPWSTNPLNEKFYTVAIDDTSNAAWVLSKTLGGGLPTRVAKASASDAVPTWSFLATVLSNPTDSIDSNEAGDVYFSNESQTFGPVHRFQEPVGITQVAFPLEPSESAEALHVDRRDGKLHVVSRGSSSASGNTGGYRVHDPATGGTIEVLDTSPLGEPVTIVVNDWIDRTSAFPKTLPVTTSVALRLATHGHAGELAGLAITAVDGLPIGPMLLAPIGLTDGGGFRKLSIALSAGALSPGLTVRVQGGRLDAATSQIVLAAPVDLVTVP